MEKTGISYLICSKFMYPQKIVDARLQVRSGTMSSPQLRDAEMECLQELVNRQVDAGLKIVSDGCIMRAQWDFDFYFGLQGVERRHIESGYIYEDCDLHHPVPVITGPIGFNSEHPLFVQYSNLASVTPAGVDTSVLLPSPAHFLLWLIMHDNTWKSVYTDIGVLMDDIGRAYRQTVLKIRDLGCRHIIMEDRSWRYLCHRDGIKRIIQSGHDLHQLASGLQRVNDKALEDIPADMDVMLYVKRLEGNTDRDMISRHCDWVSQKVFGHDNVSTVILDMPDGNDDNTMSIIKNLPADKRLIIGVVDGRYPQLEDTDALKTRIRHVRHLTGDRLRGITVTGGFKRDTSSINTTAFLEDDQWKKINFLRRLVEAI